MAEAAVVREGRQEILEEVKSADESLIESFNVRRLNANRIVAGKIQSSDGKTFFDLDNKYLNVNDGTNDRVLIGYQAHGF